MTKQQKTYTLLLIVIAVWGIIGYQVFNQLNHQEDSISLKKEKLTYIPKERIEHKNYIVKANYRDPFLGKYLVKKKRKTKKTKEEILPFPTVVYNGIIDGGSKKSYIFTVNGKQEILKPNNTFKGITLIKATNENATVKFKGIIKKIVIQ